MSWISPELIEILLTILKAVVILLVVVTCGAFMSFGERRLLGLFQNRYGPNRVGWGGSLQLVADMIKMFFKEDWIPKFSDRVIFTLAPMIAFTSLLLAFAIVPVSPGWVVADLNIGILFFLMMAGLALPGTFAFRVWRTRAGRSSRYYEPGCRNLLTILLRSWSYCPLLRLPENDSRRYQQVDQRQRQADFPAEGHYLVITRTR